MGKIDDACKGVVDEISGALSCGVVDLRSGLLLGIFNRSQYTESLNEIVAAAAMDFFRGPNLSRIEQLVRAHRRVREDGEHYFEEIHIASKHNFHFMKVIKHGRAVLVVVTDKGTNVGMGWVQLRTHVATIEPFVP
mgnify:CR=1 FL=1